MNKKKEKILKKIYKVRDILWDTTYSLKVIQVKILLNKIPLKSDVIDRKLNKIANRYWKIYDKLCEISEDIEFLK